MQGIWATTRNRWHGSTVSPQVFQKLAGKKVADYLKLDDDARVYPLLSFSLSCSLDLS